MSIIDEVVEANRRYVDEHRVQHVSPHPRRHLVVLTCMDTRLSMRAFGLEHGDAHILRNAGGIVTDDVIRSLLVSHHLLETRECMIVNHTDCGMMKSSEDELRARIRSATGVESLSPARFYAFRDLKENVRQQLEKLRSHPWISRDLLARGFIFDVDSGRLSEVTQPAPA